MFLVIDCSYNYSLWLKGPGILSHFQKHNSFLYFNHMKHLRSLELQNVHLRDFITIFSKFNYNTATHNADRFFSFFRSLYTLREVQASQTGWEYSFSFLLKSHLKKKINKNQMVATGMLSFCSEACTAIWADCIRTQSKETTDEIWGLVCRFRFSFQYV